LLNPDNFYTIQLINQLVTWQAETISKWSAVVHGLSRSQRQPSVYLMNRDRN